MSHQARGPVLRTHVHVQDQHGKRHVFGPDDDVPDWAQAKINNPKAWEVPPEHSAASPTPADPAGSGTGGPTAPAPTHPVPTDPVPPGPVLPGPAPTPPPLSGRGSGAEAWATYAAETGVDVPAGASRELILGQLRAAGVAVDQPAG